MHKLREFIEHRQEIEESTDWNQYYRDQKKAMELLRDSQSPDMLREKEYHFDEGVGVSLADHVETLKSRYPQARVQTRRDRDGFAIVKISHEPEYKYNLEAMLDLADPSYLKRFQAETLELILKAGLPEG